jgi:hypothetical protein
MVNKRFLQTAERWKNPSLPDEKTQPVRPATPTPQPNTNFPANPDGSFLFSYDHPQHGQFFQELIAKTNERFSGTHAEIPTGTSGEIQGHLIKRLGLITTIYNNPQLKGANLYPITPAQSEALLKDGKLTNPEDNWEDFGMVLYDRSQSGYNPKEAQAIYDSLKSHRQDLGLSESDLENKLIIVNAGAEVDSSMPHGVKPIVLPGLTQVYQHEVLEKVGEDPSFDGYGLNGGLPLLNQLGSGSRTLYLPDETEDIGLRALYRDRVLDLNAWYRDLAGSSRGGRVNFARSASL